MKFFKKNDIIIVMVLVFIGIFIWGVNYLINSKKTAKAEIYYMSQLVKTVELDRGLEESFKISQNENVTIHVFNDGSIRFEKSNCPDQICVNTGKIRKVGQSAACLPNKIIIKIVPKNKRGKNDIDMIAN